jgi:heme exporter protein D
MSWGSLSEFLAMGGYGLYVWGSYVMALLCIVIEVLLLKEKK